MINFHNFFIWIEIYVYCLESKSLIALYDCVCVSLFLYLGFPGGSDNKASAHNARDPGSIPRSGRSPEEWNGNPLQYPCLENSMDYTVHGVANSQTGLSNFHFHFHCIEYSGTVSLFQAQGVQKQVWKQPWYSWYDYTFQACLVAQMIKNLPIMWENQVQSLGQEDPLKKGVATHSRILTWKIPWTEEPGGL